MWVWDCETNQNYKDILFEALRVYVKHLDLESNGGTEWERMVCTLQNCQFSGNPPIRNCQRPSMIVVIKCILCHYMLLPQLLIYLVRKKVERCNIARQSDNFLPLQLFSAQWSVVYFVNTGHWLTPPWLLHAVGCADHIVKDTPNIYSHFTFCFHRVEVKWWNGHFWCGW